MHFGIDIDYETENLLEVILNASLEFGSVLIAESSLGFFVN